MPDYKDKDFLRNHAIDMLEWLKPICKDMNTEVSTARLRTTVRPSNKLTRNLLALQDGYSIIVLGS